MRFVPLIAAAIVIAGPAFAQAADPNQPDNNGSAAASQTVPPGEVAPGVDPGTSAANASVQGNIAATAAVNSNISAQYSADLATYDAAVAQHGRQRARFVRQRQAYADAMAAWRVQVAACEKGHTVACNAPSPSPSSF